jgi:hypothetical protein
MESKTTTETKPERPDWPSYAHARFPVLWKQDGAWRLRVLREQDRGATMRWEDTGEFAKNDRIDGMAKALRGETEAYGPEAVAIATKKKIPARTCREGETPRVLEPRATAAHVAEIRSCAEIMAPTPEIATEQPAAAAVEVAPMPPVVDLDEHRRLLYWARRARQVEKCRRVAAEKRERKMAERQAAQA